MHGSVAFVHSWVCDHGLYLVPELFIAPMGVYLDPSCFMMKPVGRHLRTRSPHLESHKAEALPSSAGASRQSRSGPENVHGGAEKGNYSKRLQQRWGLEVQTRLHKGERSDTNFIQHLTLIQKSVRKTRQLTFSLLTYTSYKQSQEILRAWEWHPVIISYTR